MLYPKLFALIVFLFPALVYPQFDGWIKSKGQTGVGGTNFSSFTEDDSILYAASYPTGFGFSTDHGENWQVADSTKGIKAGTTAAIGTKRFRIQAGVIYFSTDNGN